MATGRSLLFGTGVSALSQRSIVNLNVLGEFDYAFINHYLNGDASTGPIGSTFTTGTPWPALIDSQGWPNVAGVSGTSFGGSARIPDSSNFSGPYIVTWDGSGRVDFNAGTWTESNLVAPGACTITIASPAIVSFANSFASGQQIVFTTTGTLPTGISPTTVYYVSAIGLSGSSFQISATNGGASINTTGSQSGTHTLTGTYSRVQNGRWDNRFDTISPYIVVTNSGISGPTLFNVTFQRTDPNLTGSYLKNFKLYRQVDEPNLIAGKVFRSPFKQQIANLCPSAIRSMNWIGNSASTLCRFENRGLPITSGYNGVNWNASPVYASAVAGTNQYTLAASSPTGSNPKTTPASMQHGEIAVAVVTNASVRTGSVGISAITNANPGQITATGHPYLSGDKVALELSQSSGMQALNRFPCTIAVVDANNFTIGVDTTSLGTYTHQSGDVARAVLTLQVGSGNDRIAYPLCDRNGDTPYNRFSGALNALNYYEFFFDKNCAPSTDGTFATFTGSVSGTTLTASSITGTIAIGQTVGGGTMAGGTIITGGSGTTWTVNISQVVASTSMTSVGWVYGAWIATSIQGFGPSGSIPIEVVTTLVNEINALGPAHPVGLWMCLPFRSLNALDPDYNSGSDWALNAVSTVLSGANGYAGLTFGIPLYLEYSNETWNTGGGFWASGYLSARGYRRWYPSGPTNSIDMQLLLSTYIMRAVKSSNPNANIKYNLGGWGDQGTATFGGNLNRINGSSTPGNAGYWFGIDPVSSGFGAPMTNYDAFATATYLGPQSFYDDTGPVTSISISSPAIVTMDQNFLANRPIIFTGGTLPTGVTAGATYYVSATGLSNTSFQFSVTPGGASINTSGTQSGGHSVTSLGFGSFTDDSAMYNGTDNSANGGGNYSGAASQTQAIINFVAAAKNAGTPVSNNSSGIDKYLSDALTGFTLNFANAVKPYGKISINYEGGTGWAVKAGQSLEGSHVITSADSTFLMAVTNSTQWRDAQVNYFNRVAQISNAAMQAVYIFVSTSTTDMRWAYCMPDTYQGGVEGAGLGNSPVWVGMGTRNQGLS